ncbi:transcription antitermination factor NusB [Desulfoscipio geothermicus]|uniref:Transcription antitermination protein NusB n=1 Tax=Desulfoscipio geothermicus DSM 3669 TaxID=1121426 RepID=A0A1I6DBA1_9FIRM|nr:transcription antitermination factor NusB [Desulfoscipio geothermicus]SFR02641.1 NusB antitermination factor [Desulfoscipio geothermicus DSM 3669]
MGRRQAREAAMQVLYQVEVGRVNVEEACGYVQENLALADRDMEYTRYLVHGTIDNLPELDKTIAEYSRDWHFSRLAAVDKSILRMALFEMLYAEDIPESVAINEAVELTKVFSGKESGKFINGILGAILKKEVIKKRK